MTPPEDGATVKFRHCHKLTVTYYFVGFFLSLCVDPGLFCDYMGLSVHGEEPASTRKLVDTLYGKLSECTRKYEPFKKLCTNT